MACKASCVYLQLDDTKTYCLKNRVSVGKVGMCIVIRILAQFYKRKMFPKMTVDCVRKQNI